jgi:hypothetical protein
MKKFQGQLFLTSRFSFVALHFELGALITAGEEAGRSSILKAI